MKASGIEKQGKKKGSKSTLAKVAGLVLILVVVAGGIALFAFFNWRSSSSATASKKPGIYTVRRDDLPITVTESGDIKAVNSKDIKSEVEGRTKIISIVDEGTIITPNDVNNLVLVELDASEIEQRLTQQEIRFLNAEAGFTEAKESLDIQKKQNESDINKGELKVRFALMDLQKYLGKIVAEKLIASTTDSEIKQDKITTLIEDANLGGEALQKLRDLNDKIMLAESKLEQASDKLMWTEKLYEKEYVAETKLRADQLDVQSLQIQMKSAATALKLFRVYEFPKESQRKLSDYDEAKLELERTLATTRSKIAQAEAKLKSNEAQYSVQKEELEKLQRQLKACVIKAPASGQVVYSSSMNRWERRNRPIEVGAEIQERQKIISIPDLSEMKVEIKVHEIWVDKVKVGQEAKITVSAFPEESFTGEVLKKAPLADQERWWDSEKAYETDVRIDGTHDFLKTGMSAKVEIMIEQLEDVITVPIQAVVNREGKKFCYVQTSKDLKPREVETGAFNNDFVEIKSGLAEGEKVSLNPPRLIESESPAESTE